MQIDSFEGFGRTIMVRFMCYRCKRTAARKLQECRPDDHHVRDLSDLIPPEGWRDGGFYYPMFCPECAEKYDKFMEGENDGN